MSTKKKVIVLVSMVLLLAITTTLNIVLGLRGNGTGEPTGGAGAKADFFSEQRATMTTNFDSLMKYYDSIINNSALEEVSAKQDAANKKLALLANKEKQDILDIAIKSLGFNDAIVAIDSTSSNVYVYLKTDSLSVDDMKKVCALVTDNLPTTLDDDIIFTQVP